MKKIFFLLIVIFNTVVAMSQSIGIGTTTPNASAQMDISSSNKGVLIPRMTSTSRVLINNPANGLLVYDTTLNRIYQYQNGIWRFLINNDYWVQSSTRNWVYNGTDSVGIGNSSPTQRLDVNGNIRSRDDLLADGRVVATGIITGGGLSTSGGLTIGSNGLVGGNLAVNADLSTNSDLIVNNTAATIQLRNGSSVNKGFFQLSGDDVRFGTNSGNTLGDLYMRLDGNNRFKFENNGRMTLLADANATLHFASAGVNQATLQVQGQDLTINAPNNKVRISNVLYTDDATNRVGIGTITPTEKLHVSGNMLVTGTATFNSGRITSTVSGTANNLLPLAYGKVSYEGNKISGTDNFTSANRVGPGEFNLFVTGANSTTVLVVSAEAYTVSRISYRGAGWYSVQFMYLTTEGANVDFNFVMYKP